MNNQSKKAWICPICGYIHYGDTPPEECPVCGAAGSTFEPYVETVETTAVPAIEIAVPVVIVGAGIAGLAAAEAARKIDPNVQITLISEEAGLPYYRLNLTRYLAGEVSAGALEIHPREWYEEHAIELLTGVKIVSIDIGQKKVMLDGGKVIPYGRLILATGARPFMPPIDGSDRMNVTTLRTLADADRILAASNARKNIVCIGGGILGLETAGAIARTAGRVTVLETAKWLMPRQLNQKAAAVFGKMVQKLGIDVRTNVVVKQISGAESATGVALEDGASLPADLVVISAGVRPNVDVARSAGLSINHGIVVDNQMRTSHPDIFAAGDSAEHNGVVYGTWNPAQLQGSIAGMSALNQSSAFPGLPRANTLKVLGIDLFSIGLISPEAPGDIFLEEEDGDHYFSFVFRGGKMAGAILLGDASVSSAVKKAVEERVDFSSLLSAQAGVQAVMAALRV